MPGVLVESLLYTQLLMGIQTLRNADERAGRALWSMGGYNMSKIWLVDKTKGVKRYGGFDCIRASTITGIDLRSHQYESNIEKETTVYLSMA